ncbi:MAG: ABC transporter ATP-binding protein [Coriobacteriales bacterium]|nr:ABC transporter ATP-binding protein [Coriobacteriales bacterium]
MLEVKDLRAGYYKKEVVHGVSFTVERGEFVCIIGSNGCGKTTILKNLLGLIKPFGGQVTLDGKDALTMNDRERAQHFAYIPQAHTPPFPFTVADVVIMGRTPYVNRMATVSEKDKTIAFRALRQLSIDHLADHVYTKLSGGQQQLVLIARALAQQPDLLVMDEPTASLDFGNQQLVLSQMKKLTQQGMSVLMVTHDPDHALFCADKVLVMENGRLIATGTPAEVITKENLERIYDSKVCIRDIVTDEGEQVRVAIPLL